MGKARSWRGDAVNLAEFDAWDRAMRRKLGFFAGLRFFQRHSSEHRTTWTVAARHWPHKLCCDWALHWTPWKEYYDGPRRWRVWLPRYGSCGFQFRWGTVTLSWQDYGHMAGLGPMGEEAPKIIWRHHIERERADAPALH